MPRVISATPVRDQSTIETLSSTFSTLSAHASSGFKSISAARDSLPFVNKVRKTDHDTPYSTGSSPSPIFTAMGGRADDQTKPDLEAELASLVTAGPSKEVITWCAWDRLPSGLGVESQSQPALIVAYATGGLQIYSKQADDLVEVLNYQQILLPGDHVAGRVLAAKIQSLPGKAGLSLVVVTEAYDNAYVLSRCSFKSQMVEQTVVLSPIDEAQRTSTSTRKRSAAIQLNRNYLIISQSYPPALHLLDPMSLKPLHSPITDVTSPQIGDDLVPTFHLSGRLLAYASTNRDSSGPNVYAPPPPSSPLPGKWTPGPASSTTKEMTAEQVHMTALEAGAQATDLAKRVGDGLLSGLKTVNHWRASYLDTQRATADAPKGGLASPIRPYDLSNLGATSSSPAAAPQASPAQYSSHDPRSAPPGCTVVVVDLKSLSPDGRPRQVARFRPDEQNIACVRLDSTASLIFVADAVGHAFNVFEQRPRSASLGSSADTKPAPVIHRLRLLRGMTAAQVCDAKWTPDRQWLGVLTGRGVVHSFHIGARHVCHALGAGTTLTAFGRSPRPKEPTRQAASSLNDKLNAFAHDSSLEATIPASPAFVFASQQLGPATSSTQSSTGLDVLVFHPAVALLTLSRLSASSTTVSDSIAATATEASNRISGLTAMMRRGTATEASPEAEPSPGKMRSSKNGRAHQSAASTPTAGSCLAIAIWSQLARTPDAPEVRPERSHTSPSATSNSGVPSRGWVSLAEVDTYERRNRSIPTSVYLSYQYRFKVFVHRVGQKVAARQILLDVPRADSKRLETREAITVRPGSDNSAASTSFDINLAKAISSRGFHPSSLESQSGSSRIPSFPQGQPARRPSWRSSVASGVTIPIRTAAAASRDISRGVATSIGRPGSKDQNRSAAGHTPLSFDEDITHDAHIFADARQAAPSPNGAPASFASVSPFGHDRASAAGSNNGSTDTPPTAVSDGTDDYEEDPNTWTAARGLQEDVEGDSLGWDCFADPEFGGKRTSEEKQSHNKSSTGKGGSDHFMIDDHALDDDSAKVDTPNQNKSAIQMPAFARKNNSSGNVLSTSHRSGGGSMTPGGWPTSSSQDSGPSVRINDSSSKSADPTTSGEEEDESKQTTMSSHVVTPSSATTKTPTNTSGSKVEDKALPIPVGPPKFTFNNLKAPSVSTSPHSGASYSSSAGSVSSSMNASGSRKKKTGR